MDDYTRIAKVIEYLNERHAEQPSLNEMAVLAGLSESHFHRLFRRWAGVTPKDFVQCLTAEYARSRLLESASVLESALDSGLSGPGRLHDLMVSLEAATPGEIKTGGAGLEVAWGVAVTPFGWATVGWTDRGICHLAFHSEDPVGEPPSALEESWPKATLMRRSDAAVKKLGSIFDQKGSRGDPLKVLVRGTDFQVQVWRALLKIPSGQLITYGTLSECVGKPGAARAVGSACGANSIGYLIPCHRVIRETGIVKGYRWGDARKRAMLVRESTF
tara:strand:+ start:4579 stop:5400 length:822 start_codon:yes stop_codon:yes gene_type:complete